MSAPDELLPCPFCGDESRLIPAMSGGWNVIHCDNCGASGPYNAQHWNRRADAPKADSALADELTKLLRRWDDATPGRVAGEASRDMLIFVRENAAEILAALRAQPGGAVPRDATPAMVEAGLRAGAMSEVFGLLPRKIWRAMHDAATKADAREDDAERQPVEGRG